MKKFLQEQNTSVYRLARMLNEAYGRSASDSNLLNKLSRSSFKVTELMDIAELFGYEVKFVKKAIECHENNNKHVYIGHKYEVLLTINLCTIVVIVVHNYKQENSEFFI